MGAVIFELRDAVVQRDERELLHIEKFSVAQGERLAILGPNGAGKSTLIKLFTREMLPLWRERAPVLVMGDERPTLADIRKVIGVVSMSMQDQIDVNLCAREIVVGGSFGSLGVPLHAVVTPSMIELADSALEELGIGALATRDMRTLSTGEARRVLIARAIIHGPRVLVLDEPCSGLDPEAAYHMRETIQRLAEQGRTIMLVTHHVEDIVSGIERIVALKGGKILADGEKRKILTTETIRTLFGVPLTIEERDGSYRLW